MQTNKESVSLAPSNRHFKESFELNERFHPFAAANFTHSGVWTGQTSKQKVKATSASNDDGKIVRCRHVRAATLVIVESLHRERLHHMFCCVLCLVYEDRTTWKCPFVTFGIWVQCVFLWHWLANQNRGQIYGQREESSNRWIKLVKRVSTLS